VAPVDDASLEERRESVAVDDWFLVDVQLDDGDITQVRSEQC
jgi:hypothetical protein